MQTEVNSRLVPLLAGQAADQHTARNAHIVSAHSEEAAEAIKFGLMLIEGAARDGALLPSAQAEIGKLLGISVRSDYFSAPTQINADGGVLPGMSLGAARTGRWAVRIEADVTRVSEVHVRMVANGAELAGAFRPTADGADTIDITAFAKWVYAADLVDDGGLALLEINLPNQALATLDV